MTTSVSPDPPSLRVSTTFYPGAQLFPTGPQNYGDSYAGAEADVILSTIPEEIHFYVHSQHLLRRSVNAFAFLIAPQSLNNSQSMGEPSPAGSERSGPGGGASSSSASSSSAASRPVSRTMNSGGSGSASAASGVSTRPTSVPSQPSRSPSQPQSRSPSQPQRAPHQQLFIPVHENADVLNLLLHAVYNISPERYAPSLDTLSRLPGALLNYGYSLDEHIAPGSELARLFLSYARQQPLDVYALAAAYNLEHLAQRASRPSLSTKLSEVTDHQVLMMGSVYLRRLILLHVNRLTALKQILLTLPSVHPHDHVPTSEYPSPSSEESDAMDTDASGSPDADHPNPNAANTHPASGPCDGTEKSVLRAWALATAYLAWEAQPDISAVKLAQILAPLLDQVACKVCKENLQKRIASALDSWAHVKDTI